MKLSILKKQNGVGFIEVLITTVVIAIGLLAVAALQGGFIFSSGESKTRSEALTLAEQKIEELRNNIDLAGYDAIPNSNTAVFDGATITGSNAVFTRSWVVNAGGSADRKKVSVIVTWDSDGGIDSDNADGDADEATGIIDADERVNVVTEMTFIDPAKSALYALETAGGTGAVPSPRQNASEDVNAASEGVVGTNLAITDMDVNTTGAAGIDAQLQVDPDDSGTLITLSQIAPNSHFYTATHSLFSSIEAGVIAVFLCSDADNDNNTADTCSHIQNHFGGVVHRIKGTVFSTSGNGLSNILVAWTSSEIHSCYIGSSSSSGDLDSMPYECVNAGNCNATAEGTRTATGDHATDEGCFVDAVVSDAQINARNVGPGGEFGDVGVLGLDYAGGGQEQTCFLEDTTDPATSPFLNTSGSDVLNENYLFSVTKRLYITRRLKRNGSINEFKSEGINRSYTNHNFFIIARGNGASANEECNTEVTTEAQQVAPREIARAFNEGTDNSVVVETAYSGGTNTANTLTGNVTGSATDLRLFIPETGTCYLNNALDRTVDSTAYACVVASDETSINIIGSSNQHKNTTPSVFAECTKAVDGVAGCHWLGEFTNAYDDGGAAVTGCSTPWSPFAAIAENADITAYSTSDCDIAITRTCSSASLGGDNTAIYADSSSCTAAASALPCDSPWTGGNDLASGTTVDTYSDVAVAFGSSCPAPVSTTCTNGVLSNNIEIGSVFQSCTVDAPINCVSNWDAEVLDNSSVTAYDSATVNFPATCDSVSEQQSCTSGVLSPNNYTNADCRALCTVPNINGLGTNNTADLLIVHNLIIGAGFLDGGTAVGGNLNDVSNQNWANGTTQTCGETITYDY